MSNEIRNDRGNRTRHSGLLAHSILTRSSQRVPQVIPTLPTSSAVIWVGEHLNQSEGLSEWSAQLRGALSETLAEYLVATAHNWSHEVAVLAYPVHEETPHRFQRLADEWRKGRGVSSSISQLVMHPAYQQIIGMGQMAVPLLLRELERVPDQWFWALKAITGEDPIADMDRGNLKKMTQAWLEWGRNRGIL